MKKGPRMPGAFRSGGANLPADQDFGSLKVQTVPP